ncbi:hypothetical protein [Lentilactobacillus sunkii]|uniref:hypothetical protein n=1 Tax=Lentilactobacillus sunkii TaxID=481719 RepID=UPI00070F0C22|nr:hypothetical protein [Lentilactobacillus sunkii]
MKRIILGILATSGMALGLVGNNQASANKQLKSAPVSIRGTWYHFYGKYYGTRAHMNKMVIGKHSLTEYSNGHTYYYKGSKFGVDQYRETIRYNGYKKHYYYFHHLVTFGDTPAYAPAHMKVAGKYRHVLLESPQQGPTPIYTRFKPSKVYQISGHYLGSYFY